MVMTPKQKAAQIYDQYWSAVSRRPASNKDPLPDIRPLIEKAIIEAEEAKAKAERKACAELVDELRRRGIVDGIGDAIRARSES